MKIGQARKILGKKANSMKDDEIEAALSALYRLCDKSIELHMKKSSK